jgi:hypothetical protein
MYVSRRTGPVVTSVQVHPVKTIIVAIVLGVVGIEAILSLSPLAIISGAVVIWWAVGMTRVSWRQIRRAIRVYLS